MKKRGRPRKTADTSLRGLVSVAMTFADVERICKLARAEGLSVSAFIRKRLKHLGILATDQL